MAPTAIADRFPPTCVDRIARPDGFWAGKVTDGGETPEAYFSKPADGRGRPRFVLLAGAPGAGKSTWARTAEKQGWVFVACDDVRVAMLAEWRAQGKLLDVKGQGRVLADPADGAHFWAPGVVEEMIVRTRRKMYDALEAKRPVVIEGAGPHLMPIRAARMSAANVRGYGVEGLFFAADDIDGHVANLRTRVAGGGTAPTPELVTERLLELTFFGSPFRVDPGHRAAEEVPEVAADFDWMEELPHRYRSPGDARRGLTGVRKAAFERYLAEDVFHRLDFVWVTGFSR